MRFSLTEAFVLLMVILGGMGIYGVFMRPSVIDDPFVYCRRILDVRDVKDVGDKAESETFLLLFNKPVPNSTGTLLFKIEGESKTLQLLPVSEDDGRELNEGDPTSHLRARWSRKKISWQPCELVTRQVTVYSHLDEIPQPME